MNKYLLYIVSVLFLSCSTSEKIRKSKARELIKQEAFCKCIQLSSEQMFKRDTLEGSLHMIHEEMDPLGVSTKNIWRSLYSFTQRFVQLQVSALKILSVFMNQQLEDRLI